MARVTYPHLLVVALCFRALCEHPLEARCGIADNSAMADRNDMPLIVHGAGGHGLVVAEAAAAAGLSMLGFIDVAKAPGTPIGPWVVLEAEAAAAQKARHIVAIGDNVLRDSVLTELQQAGHTLATVVHPAAVVSPSASIAPGVFIGPRAVVHAEAVVDEGAIINTAAVVEHHNRIGRCAHIAPGAVLCGSVAVGPFTLVGANATVLPNLILGECATVGAGAIILSDVADGATVVSVHRTT
jgi:sugar O-acyltransferase (sialic acid O-acetyltransferase NeuD family)